MDFCDLLGMGSGRNGKAQQVFCYRLGGKTGVLDLEEQESQG